MPEHFIFLSICAFAAGVVRGFSGFGLSAVLVASGAFLVSPKLIIPAAQCLEIIASISMLRSVWPDVNFRWLKPMLIGYFFSIPVGVAALTYLPGPALRLMGCVVLLLASSALLFKFRPNFKDGFGLRLGTGLGAGFLAGSTSLGGMLASVMLFAVELPPKALRATLTLLFFFSACYSLTVGSFTGVTTRQTFSLALWLALPLLAGIAVGARGFKHVSVENFRRGVLSVLSLLSVLGIARELFR